METERTERRLAAILAADVAGYSRPSAHGVLGAVLIFSGHPMEGIASIETHIRLDPHAPFLRGRLTQIAMGLYFTGDYRSAVDIADRVIRDAPLFPPPHRIRAAALGQLDLVKEAREAVAKAASVSPAAFDRFVKEPMPWVRPEDHAHMVEGLRKAGWEG